MSERDRDPIEQQLRPAYDERRIAATWNRIASARARKPARAVRSWAIGGACAAVAVAIIAWPRSTPVRPLQSRDPSLSLAPGAVWTARDVTLDDDSTIALAPNARLEVLTNEGSRFTTLLEAGTARFDVHPGGPRRWEIETGVATVEVVGTAFTVALDHGALEVEVTRGVVMVHGERVPGRVVRLTAGQHLVVGEHEANAEPPAPTPAVPPPPPVEPVRTPPHVVDHPVASPASMLADADRLRSNGDSAGAAKVLERVRRSDDPASAGVATFTLGRLYLDTLGKPELAAIAFAEVIEHGTPRSLIEDAYARRVEALVRAGLHERAAAALVEYEQAYPQGRRIAALRALLRAP